MATRKTSNQKKDLAEAVVFNDDERRDLPSASSFGDYELCPGLYNLTKDLPDEPNPDALLNVRHAVHRRRVPGNLTRELAHVIAVAEQIFFQCCAFGFQLPDALLKNEHESP